MRKNTLKESEKFILQSPLAFLFRICKKVGQKYNQSEIQCNGVSKLSVCCVSDTIGNLIEMWPPLVATRNHVHEPLMA